MPRVGATKVPPEQRPAHWWKKGESGNPAGKPKGKSITALLRENLDKELFVEKLIKLALEDEYFPALQYIWERLEGKISTPLEINGQPLTITISALAEQPKEIEDGNTDRAELEYKADEEPTDFL